MYSGYDLMPMIESEKDCTFWYGINQFPQYKFTHYCMWKIDSKRPDRIDISILHIAHACQLKVDGMHL